MKVLHVINCFARSGGAEKFLFDLALQMKRQGVDIEILSLVAPAVQNREFIENAEKCGIPVHILRQDALYSVKNIGRLRRFFKEHRFDVVHAHLFPAQYWCAFARNNLFKLVFTEHSTDNRRRHHWLFRFIDHCVYKFYDKIICISEKTEDFLLKQIGKMPTVIIPNGINMEVFSDAKPVERAKLLNTGSDVKLVTMCAAFRKGKDYMTLFRALKFLPENIHVLCVGDGELKDEHENYCREQGLLPRVHFLGLRKDVASIFKASDVIVLSTNYEGFSIAMLEAMTSGIPFVASDVPGIGDLVKGYTSLFPAGDERCLADSILRVLEDGEYSSDIVKKCWEFARRYDIVSTASQYVKLYNKLFI